MIEITRDIEKRIDAVINDRFFNHITPYDVIRWLNNFEDSDIHCALNLLEHVIYLRENDLKGIIKQALSTLPKYRKRHIVPLGAAGKSGALVLYWVHRLYANKATFYSDLNQFLEYRASGNWNPKKDIVIFVDDYIGSGGSVVTALSQDGTNDIIEDIQKEAQRRNLYIISAIVIDKGKDYIENNIPGSIILGDVYPKGFDPHNRIFGSYVKTKAVREMCYKYGSELYKKHPLGYDNCQGLILMQHSSPNNTVPVLWSDNFYKGKRWQPLIPRNDNLKIIRAYENRSSIGKWISRLKAIWSSEDANLHLLFTPTNYELTYAFICLMKRHTEAEIFNSMGITCTEMDNLWQKGVDLKLWNRQHRPTAEATNLYLEAIRLQGILNKQNNSQSLILKDERDYMYIPETFRGVK